MTLQEEITRRRTFAVIAHPDAGKTTLTEKLLLFGGAIHVAGAVKSNKIKKGATSDFMEIERQRGISVATSVMGFEYQGRKINILDTPGHEDFAEDTYRTLTAVDSVIIVIDGAKGVESQTRKLMDVCRMRQTPVIVFVNKLDRPCKDPFDLLDEIEKELRIRVRPLSFPISSGDTFKGVYNIYEKNLTLFTSDERQTADASTVEINDLASPELDEYITERYANQLREDTELVEGVYDAFDREAYLRAELAPVFFGSAVNNFGVKELLECFIRIAPSPRPAPTETRIVEPAEAKMTGFVFKIHANMDPNHRDRIAFLKICSGTFERNKNYLHVRSGKQMKFSSPTAFMAEKKVDHRLRLPGRHRRPARHGQLQDRRHLHRRRKAQIHRHSLLRSRTVPLYRECRSAEIQATGQRHRSAHGRRRGAALHLVAQRPQNHRHGGRPAIRGDRIPPGTRI